MILKSKIFSVEKYLFAILLSSGVASLFLAKPKVALAISFLLMIVAISWILAKQIEVKKFMIGFIFLYSFLPLLWGFQIAAFLPVIRAHRVAVLILIFFMLSKGIFREYYREFFKSNTFTFPVIFMGLSLLISSVFSIAKGASFFYFFSYIFEVLIITIIVFVTFKTDKDIETVLNTLCYASLCLAFLGLIERFTAYNFYSSLGAFNTDVAFLLETKFRGGSIRIEGPFGHPISFGAFFSMTLPFVMRRFKGDIVKFAISVGLVLFAIISTQSRSAQIGAILVILYYFFYVEKKSLLILFAFGLPILLLNINALFKILAFLDPSGASSDELANSSEARAFQVEFLMPYIKSRFMVGYGREVVPSLLLWPGLYTNTIDNWYLLYSFYYGVVGLISWVSLMIMSFAKPIFFYGKEILRDKYAPYVLVSVFIFCLTNGIVALIAFHYIFWINLGILARLIVKKREEIYAKHNNG